MSEIKLKPCPFCGGEAKINRMPHLWEYSVQCNDVDCIVHPETEGYEKREEAIEAWNTRKPMERIAEQLEVLREKEYDDSDEESDLTDPDDIYDEGRSQGRYEAFRNAIEIVQKGGAE